MTKNEQASNKPQLTQEEAKAFFDSGEWKTWSDEDVALFQLYQDRLCVDFSTFHRAIEKLLGRGVFTHEFADPRTLRLEAEGKLPSPDLGGILGKLYDLAAQRRTTKS